MTEIRVPTRAVGALAAALTLAALAVASFAGIEESEHGGAGPFALSALIALAVLAVVFGWYIPRAERPGPVGIAVGVLGVASAGVFWLGLPWVLGPAAVLLGVTARNRGAGASGLVAIALGALAVVVGVAVLIYDQVS